MEEQKETSPQLVSFVNAMLLVFLAFPQLPLWMWLSKLFQRSQCPTSTFLSGTLQPGWEIWAVVGAMLASALFLRYLLVHFTPSLQEFLGYGGAGKYWYVWPGIFLLILVLAVLTDIAANTSQFCLTSSQISLRKNPVVPVRNYDWTDVTGIQSGCRKGSKGGDYDFDQYYVLVMDDGQTVDISGSIPDFEKGYDDMMQAFLASGRRPLFNSTNVHPDCGYRNLGLLTRRP